MTNWKLNKVEAIDCTIDDSGIHTIINRVTVTKYSKGHSNDVLYIRVDIMQTSNNEPLQSFYGLGNDVRKAVIAWIKQARYQFTRINYTTQIEYNKAPETYKISIEHASYIGYEIARAMSDANYVQD